MAWVVNGVRLVESHLSVYNAVKRLSADFGFCVASNSELGNDWLVNKSADRVSHIVSDLCEAGIFKINISYPNIALTGAVREITIMKDIEEAIRRI